MNINLLRGLKELAENRRMVLEKHLKDHKGNEEEEEWASRELHYLNKLHSSIVDYIILT